MSDWTHPICERDWIERNSVWETMETTTEGGTVERLVSIRMPHRMKDDNGFIGPVARCCWCQEITISGIYTRDDPSNIPNHMEHDDGSH